MTGDEIRAAYLKFFEEKEHTVIPSSSLIPQGDPTLLLTTAGMVQIKPYFLGEATPPNRRLASCQKCFRTTDIESVGDANHLTFFEMLGNFSIGDYFKKEAIRWAWEFLTERMGFANEKLWVTVFLNDDEAFNFWREIGVPAERIVRFGEKDNFWGPAGKTGPCGPCSEIHYDFGKEYSCGKATCGPNCGCGRFSEIWNLVFTQYNQDESGKRTPLPKPNIDTGMGLERVTAAARGRPLVYETDLFAPLIECVAKLAEKPYGADAETDIAMRVVAEHGRSISFLIADGVLPSNDGRGYVLRRLLRRADLYGRRLGENKTFLIEVARTAIKRMGKVYAELAQRQDFILKVIELEEDRFRETLNTGLALIDNVLAEKATQKSKTVSGKDAFKLYDTYGFPVELTREIVAKSGFTVDMAGFEKEMEQQRERARATHKFTGKGMVKTGEELEVAQTAFTGYDCFKQKAIVLKLVVDGKAEERLDEGQGAGLVLDTTPFYGEMGGQVGDTGEIVGASGRFTVTGTVRIAPDVIVHHGKVAEGYLAAGDTVTAEVNRERRLDIARNHTATHLLHYALRQVVGEHAEQRGSLVAPDRLRFDFSHLTALTPEEISKVQRIVNAKVRENLPVRALESSYKKAIAEGVTALFDEKYGDVVRVLKIGEPAVSAELCGGTHINATGEIGYFHILSESSIGSGLRRIEAVTGRGAEEFVNQRLSSLDNIARSLGTLSDNIQDKLTEMVDELDKERKQALALERELSKKEAETLLGKVEVVKDINLLVARVSSSNQQVIREMADFLRDRMGSGIIVLGAVQEARPMFLAMVTADLVAKGYNAGEIVRQVAKVAGGGGGGKPGLGQAGGKYVEKLDEALRLVKSLI
ncbi:MAG: alanine--tRNA ligase [Dehalococcoidales bacterium]|nr:alanine--tRNA ligase [Dehalococcoidales bacterium]